jgi:hypothetical protein
VPDGGAERELLPVACTLTDSEGPQRMARWAALGQRAHPVVTHRDGCRLEVRYAAMPGTAHELRALAAAEAACCAFARWQVREDGGQPVLVVSVDPGAEPGLSAIAALFGTATARPPAQK